jgi:hypothetical protein
MNNTSYNNSTSVFCRTKIGALWTETGDNGEVFLQTSSQGDAQGFRYVVVPNPSYREGTNRPQFELHLQTIQSIKSTTPNRSQGLDLGISAPPIKRAQPDQEVQQPAVEQSTPEPEVTEPAPEAMEETPKPTKRSPKKAEQSTADSEKGDSWNTAPLVPDTEEIPF